MLQEVGASVLKHLSSCPYRVEVATHLERSLQQGRDLLSTYENKLVIDDTVPEDLRVVDRKKEELLVSVSPAGFLPY